MLRSVKQIKVWPVPKILPLQLHQSVTMKVSDKGKVKSCGLAQQCCAMMSLFASCP